MCGVYRHLLSLTKHAFFVLCMYRMHPNIIQTYRGHPNIWEASKHMGASKYVEVILTYGAVQKWGTSLIFIKTLKTTIDKNKMVYTYMSVLCYKAIVVLLSYLLLMC